MIEHPYPQGTDDWLEARRGVITASRAKDARDRDSKGKPSAKMLNYAMDTARERCGGKAAPVYQNAAMRMGSEEEQFAAIEYMARTGRALSEAFFITTDDRKFGLSLDRWVNEEAAIEVKTMVSSATLFKAMVDGDISEYRDQCVFALWVLRLQWVDLCLWAPDLPNPLKVIRINRDEAEIQRLEDDMVAFDRLVRQYEASLREAMNTEPATTSPWEPAATPAKATTPAASLAPTVAPGAIPAAAF